MRLYLSSFRLGRHRDRLLELVGREARVRVIMNALDGLPPATRIQLFDRLASDFHSIGLAVRELDLRDYFDESEDSLDQELSGCDLVWANGGNAFTLLMAMSQSGFVSVIRDLLQRDQLVYGGYSAGAVVAGPTLRGVHLVDSADPADAAPPGYRPTIEWEALGLVDYSIAPHFRSDHHESSAIEAVVQYFEEHAMAYRGLRDGEAIVVNGSVHEHLTG